MTKTLDLKIEELIAIGVAYGVNCNFCMDYHKKKALEAGATEEEMLLALHVAEGVKKGAYNRTRARAEKLFGEIEEKRCCPEGSGCCP